MSLGRVEYNVVLVGDSGVGKTSLFHQLFDGKFPKQHVPTSGESFGSKIIPLDNKDISLRIWDTAGAENQRHVISKNYEKADVFIITYDLTNRESLTNIEKWIAEIKKYIASNIKLFLVGAKLDLERKVSIEDVEALVVREQSIPNQSIMLCGELSVKDKNSVTDLFTNIAHAIYDTKDKLVNTAAREDAATSTKHSGKPSKWQRFKDFCQRNRRVLIGVGVGVLLAAIIVPTVIFCPAIPVGLATAFAHFGLAVGLGHGTLYGIGTGIMAVIGAVIAIATGALVGKDGSRQSAISTEDNQKPQVSVVGTDSLSLSTNSINTGLNINSSENVASAVYGPLSGENVPSQDPLPVPVAPTSIATAGMVAASSLGLGASQ